MIITDNIYRFGSEGIELRDGEISLDCDEMIVDHEDMLRAVHVSGLEAGDFAVFLSFAGEGESTGFIVSNVDTSSGTGVITSGDALLNSPRIWLNQHIGKSLLRLSDDEWNDFSLTALYNSQLLDRYKNS